MQVRTLMAHAARLEIIRQLDGKPISALNDLDIGLIIDAALDAFGDQFPETRATVEKIKAGAVKGHVE